MYQMVEMALRDMYKKYNNAKYYSVTDFNLEITDRKFIVFVGPSGYDKSTTLRMVAGLEDIAGDGLSVGGRIISDVAPKDRDIVMVFQNCALYPHMTVFGNIAFDLKLRKYDKAEIKKRVRSVADILSLTKYLQHKPVALSGGQRQRVALDRAIVHGAKVLLMDEPLSNLNAKLHVVMRAEIARLHQHLKATTIYMTHDQIKAMTMADRTIIMKNDFIQQVGSPKEVYNAPKSMFVAGLIGSPAMNFFKVTLNNGVISNQHGLELAIPEGRNKELVEHGYEDKELIFGIRPEDIHGERVALATMKGMVIKSEVVIPELLRAESMLYTETGDTKSISKVDARNFHHPGEMTDLAFDINKRRFFDLQTEEVIK